VTKVLSLTWRLQWLALAGRVRVSASPLLWLSLVALALSVTGLATPHHRDIG
jgi:hypothetical protein